MQRIHRTTRAGCLFRLFFPPPKIHFCPFPLCCEKTVDRRVESWEKDQGPRGRFQPGISLKGTLITCFTQTSALTQAFKQTKQSRKKINVYIQKAVTSNSLSDLSPDHKISWMDAWMRTFGVIILFA